MPHRFLKGTSCYGLLRSVGGSIRRATSGPSDPARKRDALEAAVPLGRFAHPAEIAALALFLIPDESLRY